LFLSSHFMVNAQIVLEHTFLTPYSNNPSIIHLENGGEKWYVSDIDSNRISLYNLDYTLFKTINIPSQLNHNYYIWYVSDKLFDPDAAIEFMIVDGFATKATVYKEDGSVLFSRGDSTTRAVLGYPNAIVNTAAGTKMILWEIPNATAQSVCEIYSLPGHLPYGESDLQLLNSGRCIANIFPNPNNGHTTFEYQLLPGETQGKIIFYDLKGNMRKSITAVGQTGRIVIDNTDLPAGPYLYQITTSTSTSEMKKMIMIK
jgi:hypothetical protein